MSTESVKSFIPALSPLPDNAEESLTLDFILPRLLYIGDVPITATISGAALLYRLLEDYPSDRLVIAQGNIWSEQPEWGHGDSSKSLSNVRYETLAVGRSRLLHSRFAKVYAAHLQLTARRRARTVNTLVKTFHPEAILTVAHGFSWVTAAAVAESLRIPLHLIVHDDWVSCNHLSNRMREFGRGQFAKVYRQAKTRFCASPYMAEEYERRYGINGTVLYPSQSTFTPVFESSCDSETQHFPTVSYAGTINSGGYAQSILNLAKVLEKFSGRVLLFSPHSKNELANFGLDRPNIVAHPLLDHHHLVEHLRKESDVLFIPMSFESSDNQNMRVAFPSKITDYTATGRPLLIWGPAYCSAVRWALDNSGIAEVVYENDLDLLFAAVDRLVSGREYRNQLGESALTAGKESFSNPAIRQVFYQSIKL